MARRIYIVGPTGSGKSYLGRRLCDALGATLVEGSSWVRALTGRWDHGPEASRYLSEVSERELHQDPHVSLRKLIELTADEGQDYVIAGLRNPVDFIGLWERHQGVSILLTGEATSEFERVGIEAILTYLHQVGRPPDLILRRGEYDFDAVLSKISDLHARS